MENLQDWIDEREKVELIDGQFVRITTDGNHGFHVDVYPSGHCVLSDGYEWDVAPSLYMACVSLVK